MKIYTRTGDNGETGLFGGQRVPKDHPRVQAYGEVDELGACLGVARSHLRESSLDEELSRLQSELFTVGADLATPHGVTTRTPRVSQELVDALEVSIDHYSEKLPPLTRFVLAGGNQLGACLHLARCVCRRAERSVLTLSLQEGQDPASFRLVLVYLNRLSDLLFVMARYANATDPEGRGEVFWDPPPLVPEDASETSA